MAHGEFGNWLESIGINRSTAAKFVKVYDELNDSKVSTLTHFGLSALHIIATMPAEEREKPHVLEDHSSSIV